MPVDITPFVEGLSHDLSAAATAAGPEAQAAGDRMVVALEPAMRLALMELLSQAAAEITAELTAGTVEVRLRGREPELVVEVPAFAQTVDARPAEQPASELDDGEETAISRVSLRIPESVKTRAEEVASRSGQSLNAWIVSVLRAATTQRVATVDIDLSSIPFFDDKGPAGQRSGSRRMSGWV